MNFEYVRKYKNEHAKRNAPVIYDGHLMRIANTQGDGLVLRSEKIVHANDEGLVYANSKEYEFALDLLNIALTRFVTSTHWQHLAPEGTDTDRARDIAFDLIRNSLRDVKALPQAE